MKIHDIKTIAQLAMLLFMLIGNSMAATQDDQYDGGFVIDTKQTQLMQYENLKRIDIGNPDIVRVSVPENSSSFIVIGMQPGKTDLTLWGNDGNVMRYSVRVKGDPRHIEVENLRFLLANVPGLVISEKNEDIFISGRTDSAAEYEKVAATADQFDNVIANVSSPMFDAQKTVSMKVSYLEVSRDALNQLGIEWDRVIGGISIAAVREFVSSPFSSSATTVGGGTISSGLNAVVRARLEKANGRVLKTQSLLVESGTEGVVYNGQEFPVETRDENGTNTVEYRPVGMTLNINPIANNDGLINTSLAFEMSFLDFFRGRNNNPIVRKSLTNTKLTFKDGEPMIIADFLDSNMVKSVSKVPGLGHLPILGELFKSRDYLNNKTELFILIEPNIVKLDTERSEESTNFFNKKSESSLQHTKFKLMD